MDGLLAALRALPDVTAELRDREVKVEGGERVDAWLDIAVAGTPVAVPVECRKALYPRDVQQYLWQLRASGAATLSTTAGAHRAPMLAAQMISPGAKQLLREERVGYYDSGGSLYLPAPGAYLYLEKPAPKALERTLRSLFSPRRAQVLQVLLLRHAEWFGATELAQAASASAATASEVLAELERLDWVETQGRGPKKLRHLREPAALLDTWVQQLPTLATAAARQYFVPGLKTEALAEGVGAALGAQGAHYALTGEAAAQRYAPFLSHVPQVHVRVARSARVQPALDALGARAVTEGSNVSILEIDSEVGLVAPECVEGLWLANPVQVYLDLGRGRGRSSEMAAHLRSVRLGY